MQSDKQHPLPSMLACSPLVREQAEAACLRHRLCAVAYAQLSENIAYMAFDRIDLDHQPICDFLVGCSLCKLTQYLQFTLGERVQQFLLGRGWMHGYVSTGFLLKRRQHAIQVGRRPLSTLLFTQFEEEDCHRLSFIYEETNVALGSCKREGFCQHGERMPCIPLGLVGQCCEDKGLENMTHAPGRL